MLVLLLLLLFLAVAPQVRIQVCMSPLKVIHSPCMDAKLNWHCVSVEMSSQHPHGCLSVGLSVLGYSSARLFISAAANANMLLKIIALIGQVALAANFIAKYIGKSVCRLH